MNKVMAPWRSLHGGMLRDLMASIGATVDDLSKVLDVNERTVRRWLSNDDAPRAVLMALWHESPEGRYATHLDIGNELTIYHGLAGAHERAAQDARAKLERLASIGDFGCANDPMMGAPPPGGGPGGFAPWPRYPARVMRAQARAMR